MNGDLIIFFIWTEQIWYYGSVTFIAPLFQLPALESPPQYSSHGALYGIPPRGYCTGSEMCETVKRSAAIQYADSEYEACDIEWMESNEENMSQTQYMRRCANWTRLQVERR
jgi:hypothetical protein